MSVVCLLLLEVEMKKVLIRMLILSLLVAMLISCETLLSDIMHSSTATDDTDTPLTQSQNPEEKFVGTWVYSDKNFSNVDEDLPSDLSVEFTFSFRSNATGTFSGKYFTNDIVNEEQQEFLWSCDSISSSWVLVVMQDNTATNFMLLYESVLFLSMNDPDLGKMYFAKQQESVTE
jgi:hypothetical protein